MSRPLTCMALGVACALLGCTPQGDPAITERFEDRFNRDSLGGLWYSTGGPYRIQDGQLRIRGARNRPLWLRRKLPRDVRITFDARSQSSSGDIKVEVFGDGVSKATSASYTATSYVVIFGGWNNTLNVIARLDEHGADRAVGPARKVIAGTRYRIRIERRGQRITAWANGKQLATLQDSEPLVGRGHDHFAFNNWDSDVSFDNLVIDAL